MRLHSAPSLRMFLLIPLFLFSACSLPPLEEQKAKILNNQIKLDVLTTQAFLETWGKPTYIHRERMQFFVMEDGNNLPRFRVPMGEAPQGWTTGIVSEDAFFLGYADRGEMLGFVDNRLIYREQIRAEEIHKIGNAWKREEMFKTRLETPAPAPAK